MPATRLVLTAASTAGAAVLVGSALTSGTAAPSGSPDASGHAGHVAGSVGTERGDRSSPRTATGSNRAGRLPRLRGYVGSDFTITISKRRVPKGRYRLVVKDEGTTHNWHIEGRRVDKQTSVPKTGKWVWRVRLRKGTYTIVCDTHPTTMNTSLKVTSD